MTNTLTLIRGLPGSGKSTLAKSIDAVHLEADMYFVNSDGVYEYQADKISDAHQWCQKQTEYWLKQGKNVVVSNTFIKQWEMTAYKKLARKYRSKLNVIVCRGQYGNVHDVDSETVERMRSDWQE